MGLLELSEERGPSDVEELSDQVSELREQLAKKDKQLADMHAQLAEKNNQLSEKLLEFKIQQEANFALLQQNLLNGNYL